MNYRIRMHNTVTDPAERARRLAQLYSIFCRDETAADSKVSEATEPATAKSQSTEINQRGKDNAK